MTITKDVGLELDVERSLAEFNVCAFSFVSWLNLASDMSRLVQLLGPWAGCGPNLRLSDYFAIHPSLDVQLFFGAGGMRSKGRGHVEGGRFQVKL